MNFLFVCSRNKWRSRTAETHFKNHPYHQVLSAGTDESARVKISERLLHWADLVFVMENKHRQRINERFKNSVFNEKIVVLDIPDEYQYMDEELIAMLEVIMQPHLENE